MPNPVLTVTHDPESTDVIIELRWARDRSITQTVTGIRWMMDKHKYVQQIKQRYEAIVRREEQEGEVNLTP